MLPLFKLGDWEHALDRREEEVDAGWGCGVHF